MTPHAFLSCFGSYEIKKHICSSLVNMNWSSNSAKVLLIILCELVVFMASVRPGLDESCSNLAH